MLLCMELPIGKKSKELISFLYTSTIYGIFQRLALKLWSLSCAMVDHSCRAPILHPLSKGKHSTESPTDTLGFYNLQHPPIHHFGTKTRQMICLGVGGLAGLSLT
jgi:hypothetical protein